MGPSVLLALVVLKGVCSFVKKKTIQTKKTQQTPLEQKNEGESTKNSIPAALFGGKKERIVCLGHEGVVERGVQT